MRSPDWICKNNEIECHLKRLFEHYGEDFSYFDEYLNDVLKHDINQSLKCFRDLVEQLEWLKPIGKKNEQRLQGMQIKRTDFKRSSKLQPIDPRRTQAILGELPKVG